MTLVLRSLQIQNVTGLWFFNRMVFQDEWLFKRVIFK